MFAGLVFSSQAAVIASESFKTTGAADDYSTGTALGTAGNNDVVVGNTGFNAVNKWVNATGAATSAGGVSLTHSGLVGTALTGSAQIKPQSALDRNSFRKLASTPDAYSSYFLSGLVNLGALGDVRDGDYVALGLMNNLTSNTAEIDEGMHFGISRDAGVAYLSAFAGGNVYTLLELDAATYAETFQVVLQLDVDASGNDALTAWYAADGDAALTKALDAASVETWASADDLRMMVAQTKSPNAVVTPGVHIDEVCFGTTLGDVTTLSEPVSVTLIASESFKTTAATDDYSTGTSLGTAGNNDVVVGNTGFNAANTWVNATGAAISDGGVSLTHSGLVGAALTGSVQIKPQSALDRNIFRKLASVPGIYSSYFLSGLVNLGALGDVRDGDYVALGLMNNLTVSTAGIDEGMHFGISRDAGVAYLSAFAGGNVYTLLELDAATYAETFQVVLQLDVDASGNDALTAWYAADGDAALTKALDAVSVETWVSADDLRMMVAQTKSPNAVITPGVHVDEVYFGTTLGDVTTIPESATLGLVVLSSAAMLMLR